MRITNSIEQQSQQARASGPKRKKRRSLFIPLRRFFPYLGLVAGGVLLFFQQAIWSYTENIVGNVVMDIIRFETKGRYSIEYEKVRFNLFKDEFYLRNFTVYEELGDSDEILDGSTSRADFSLQSRSLGIKVKSFLQVLIRRKLEITGLELVQPKLAIRQYEEPEKSDRSSLLVDVVSQYLTDFKIENLEVTNAALDYSKVYQNDSVFNIKLGDVSLYVDRLSITAPLSSGEQKFRSNNFKVTLLNDSVQMLPGYDFSFESLEINSADSSVKARNLNLKTDRGQDSDSVFKVNVDFPLAMVKGLNLWDLLYQPEKVAMREIDFGEFSGSLIIRTQVGKESDGVSTSPIPKRSLPFSVGKLLGSPSSLSINIQNDAGVSHMDLFGASFDYNNFELDLGLPLPFDLSVLPDLSMAAEEVVVDSYNLQHQIRLTNFLTDIRAGLFSADKLETKPFSDISMGRNTYNLRIEDVQITNLDLIPLFEQSTFSPRKVSIGNADIELDIYARSDSDQPMDFKNPYLIIKPFSEFIAIEDFELSNTSVRYDNHILGTNFSASGLDLLLQGVKIDSGTVFDDRQIMGSRQIKLSGQDVKLSWLKSRDELAIKTLAFDLLEKSLQSGGLEYVSRIPHTSTVKVDGIKGSGVEWYDLVHHKRIIADSLSISSPHYQASRIDTVYDLSKSELLTRSPFTPDSTFIRNFRVQDGNVRINNITDLTVRLNGIQSRSSNLQIVNRKDFIDWKTEKFYYSNGDFSVNYRKLGHVLTGGHVTLSKVDSVLRMNQLKITPTKPESEESRYNLTFPNILVSGFRLSQLLDSGYLNARNAIAHNPDISLSLRASIDEESLSAASLNDSVARKNSLIKWVRIRKVTMANAKTRASYKAKPLGDRINNLSAKWTDISINDLRFDSLTKFDANLDFLESIDLEFSQLNHTAVDNIDTIFIGSGKLNSTRNMILRDTKVSGRSDTYRYSASMPELLLDSDHWLSAVLNDSLAFDSIKVVYPNVSLVLEGGTEREPVQEQALTRLFEYSGKPISIASINVTGASIDLVNLGDNYLVPRLDLELHGLNLSPDNPDPLYTEDLRIEIHGLSDLFPRSLQDVSIVSLKAAKAAQTVQVNGLSIEPKVSKIEYGWRVGKQTDWIKLVNNRTSMTGIDMFSLISGSDFVANQVYVDTISIQVFRDKNVPFPKDQIRHMPQTMISNYPGRLDIRSLVINNGNIRYEELDSLAPESGYVIFTNLTAGIANITNIESRISENNQMQIGVNVDFMESGNLQADFEFDLTDEDGRHTYTAYLSSMPLIELNNMLEPNANVHIRSGHLSQMKMTVEGNSDYSIGEMQFLYDDLHINLISKKTGTTSAMGPSLGSFFANTFIINRNNPSFLVARTGDIYNERDTARSVFNYLAKTALSGVVSSIGASNNRKLIKRANRAAEEERKRKLEERKPVPQNLRITTTDNQL